MEEPEDEPNNSLPNDEIDGDNDDNNYTVKEEQEEEEEELECRVCRGPAEEGRPFFKPCKCSGSIAYTHHDCLVEWLQFTGKKKCELCGHTFEFRPLYAPDTPESLPSSTMFVTIIKHAINQIPKVGSAVLSIVTWLIVIPLITAHVYYGWIKSPKVILERYEFIAEDIVAGIVISVCIVISFLSVMSFVDFLRFHWAAQQFGDDVRDANINAGEGVAAELMRDLPPDIAEELRQIPEFRNANGGGVRRNNHVRGQNRFGDVGNRGGRQNPIQQQPAIPPEDDIEIHLALNELLGLHQPLMLMRNATWYICFIVLYLGVVVYLPWRLGGLVLSAFPPLYKFPKTDHLLTLPDLVTLFVGYVSQVGIGVLTQCMIYSLNKVVSIVHSIQTGNTFNNENGGANDNEYYKIASSLLYTSLKIITFLFLKMAFLPLLIGVILDLTTLPLISNISLETRLHDAVHNVVVSIILHWVMGISFMLTVTVSVLQLREVMHPNILKDRIKPQEQNVDLLGNLLVESNMTHVKKILDSMGIYITLLMIHVYVPIQVLSYFGLQPTWELENHYFCGNLGRLVELLVFHLSMLGILEKFRNEIGKFQHIFVRKFCVYTNLTSHLLPCNILRFDYIGHRSIFEETTSDEVLSVKRYGSLWMTLADREKSNVQKEEEIAKRLNEFDDTLVDDNHEDSVEGFMVHGRKMLETREFFKCGAAMVPTSIGRYRLQNIADNVLLYKEVPDTGNPISRPPPNWDDLAGGDAEAQGRWSWHDETPSNIERATAHREKLTSKELPKVALLLFVSWITTIVMIFGGLVIPLNTGRLLFKLFNIKPHDPIGFVTGASILGLFLFCIYTSISKFSFDYERWKSRIMKPPLTKLCVFSIALCVWFLLIPLMIGEIYANWANFVDRRITGLHLLQLWTIGSIMFHFWGYLCFFEVFTTNFWVEIGLLNIRDRENIRQDHFWQGRQGRISLLLNQFCIVFAKWEWDKVDTVMIKNVIRQPFLFFFHTYMWPMMFSLLLPGAISESVFSQEILYKIVSVCTTCITTAFYRQETVKTWFKKMHKIAKDDLYLIGETLVNYER